MSQYMDDAPLSKEDQLEEEMRQELKDVGLYYENMSVDEMKQIINVLNESKNDSRIPNEDIVDDSALFVDRSPQDTSKVTDNNPNRPLPSFSYRQAVTSGTSTNHSSPLDEITNSNDKNPQASSSNSYDKNFTPNSPDSEPIYERNSNSNLKKDEEYPTLSSSRYETRSRTGEGSRTTRAQETKKSALTNAKRVSLERWNLNPLDFVKDKNTTPLYESQDSKSHVEETEPYCSEEIDMDSEEFDKLCQQMEEKLSTLNKQCLVELETNQKLAAPIKINHEEAPANKVTAKEKSSSSSSSFSTNTPGPSTPSSRNNYDRATKRKALSTIAAATDFLYENDENSDDEFCNTKKRKFQQGKKVEEAAKKNQENQKNKNNAQSIETISIDDSKDSLDVTFDNSDLHNMRKNSNKKVENSNGSDESQQYPRRVVPPNPGKKNFKGPRAKNKNNNNTSMGTKSEPEKKKPFLNDEEIDKTLQEIDETIEENDGGVVDIVDEIKPPQPKRVNKRLSLATSHLENARETKEQKQKAEKEAKERKEKEEQEKKDQLISSRMQEMENEKSRKEEKERKSEVQTAFYNNLLSSRSRVTRASVQQNKTEEEIAEDLLLQDDDDELQITEVIEKHLCPICQKPFPADQIETHASGCDSFSADSNVGYNRPSTSHHRLIYSCEICEIFKTEDGHEFEEHVVNCRTRRRLMNGGWITK